MLYNLLVPLAEQISALNLFRYITFRTGGAVITALIISFVVGPAIINWLKRIQGEGQPIRDDGPADHLTRKQGTPTMGGFLILVAVVSSTLLWADLTNRYVWAVIAVTLGFGAVGAADDFLKLTRRSSHGVPGKVKLVLEIAISLAVVLWIMNIASPALATGLTIPFFKDILLDLGWMFAPLAVFVVVGASNAVNLTDGLDGLAIVPVMIAFALFRVHRLSRGQYRFLQLPPAPLCDRQRRTDRVLRRAGGRGAWLPVVQRAPGHGLHGRHGFALHGRGAGHAQRHHQA
jgi:phospho-N-acetylmuramoyl-pentapeptide-transferase